MRILLLLALPLSLIGAAPGGSPAPNPARFAAASRLLEAMHYDSTLDRTIDAMSSEMRKSLAEKIRAQSGNALSDQTIAKIGQAIEDHVRLTMAKHRSNLRRGMTLIYASHFSAAELNRLAAIQSDPVMVKMLAETPQLSAESMALAQAAIGQEEAALKAEIETIIRENLSAKDGTPHS